MLGFSSKAQEALWRLLESEAVKILPLDASETSRSIAPAASLASRSSPDGPLDQPLRTQSLQLETGCGVEVSDFRWTANGPTGVPASSESYFATEAQLCARAASRGPSSGQS